MRLFHILCVCISISVQVNCIKWTNPLNRTVYGVDKQPLSLKWDLDLEGERFWGAEWKIGVEVGNAVARVVMIVDREYEKRTDTLLIKERDEFGYLDVKALDSGFMKVIEVSATDEKLNVALDTVHVKYLGEVASFDKSDLLAEYNPIENTNSSKSFNASVTVKGDPKPNVFWELDGKEASSLGFKVEESSRKEGEVVFVTSTISKQLAVEDNGLLNVITKHGDLGDLGPTETKSARINVQYSPRNVAVKHNVTGTTLYQSSYVNITCIANANPTPVFTLKENSKIIQSGGKSASFVVFIGAFHHKRSIKFTCVANNSIGDESETLTINLRNVTLLAKRIADEDTDWWVYFGVAVAVAILVFLGFAILLCVYRRRIRSLDLRSDIDKLKARQIDFESRSGPRSNGANHIYDMNERGFRGTATTATQFPRVDQSKKRPELPYGSSSQPQGGQSLSGHVNSGFDIGVYDTAH